jgi:hypothetical protein
MRRQPPLKSILSLLGTSRMASSQPRYRSSDHINRIPGTACFYCGWPTEKANIRAPSFQAQCHRPSELPGGPLMCGKNPWGDDDSNLPAIIPRSSSIVTGIRSGLAPYLDGKTTLREASDLRLKAIDEGNTKIGPGKGTSRANQNAKRDERVVHYDFKIFVVGGRRQYDDGGKEKQPDEYEPDKELSERTFIRVDETINNWKGYFKGLIEGNGKWEDYCSTHRVELDPALPVELLIFSPPDFSKLKGKGRKAEDLSTTMLKYFIRAGWPKEDCLSLHRLLTWNDIKEKGDVFWRVQVRRRTGTYILRDGSSVPPFSLPRVLPSRSLSREATVILSTETGSQTKHIKIEGEDTHCRLPPINPMRTVPEEAPFIDLISSSQESQDTVAIKKEAEESKDNGPRKQKTRLTPAQKAMISKAQ